MHAVAVWLPRSRETKMYILVSTQTAATYTTVRPGSGGAFETGRFPKKIYGFGPVFVDGFRRLGGSITAEALLSALECALQPRSISVRFLTPAAAVAPGFGVRAAARPLRSSLASIVLCRVVPL